MSIRGLKPHIGIFGRCNAGKSSFLNAITSQDVAIVSDLPGTTTDPVKKIIELDEIGPVVFIDTGGLDDRGDIGNKRVSSAHKTVEKIDLAVIVISEGAFDETEKILIANLRDRKTPYIIIHNKSDIKLLPAKIASGIEKFAGVEPVEFSSRTFYGKDDVLKAIRNTLPESAYQTSTIIGDIVSAGDNVLLVTPIDTLAPRGRMILPEMQVLRDALDNHCIVTVIRESELEAYWSKCTNRPRLVVTDSQAFKKVAEATPADVSLTSFSILFARYKGDFDLFIEGTRKISKLKDGDKILILESCSHHLSSDDIGRVKLPAWLKKFTGKKLDFDIVAGEDSIPKNLKQYAMAIQCGGCMFTRKQILNRLEIFKKAGLPVSNYGMSISYCLGIFERAIKPLS